MSSIEEKLSDQFYQWELRGRGWQVFPEPVHPEPPFRPFYGHFLPTSPVIDDGHRPTFLSSMVEKLSRKLSTEPPPAPTIPEREEEPEPKILIRESLQSRRASGLDYACISVCPGRRAVRSRLDEATLPKADLRPRAGRSNLTLRFFCVAGLSCGTIFADGSARRGELWLPYLASRN
jgi:hypothetical protein